MARARVRYALLLGFAAVPLVDVGEIKPGPLGVGITLFGIHALISLVAYRRERFWPRDVLTTALWLGCFLASGVFVTTLAVLRLRPPVTPDGHRVMAIGQALAGLVVGGAAGLAVAVLGSLRVPPGLVPPWSLVVTVSVAVPWKLAGGVYVMVCRAALRLFRVPLNVRVVAGVLLAPAVNFTAG